MSATARQANGVGRTFGGRRAPIAAVSSATVSLRDDGTCTGIVGGPARRVDAGPDARRPGHADLGPITFNGTELRMPCPLQPGCGVPAGPPVRRPGTTSSFDPRRTLRDSVRLPASASSASPGPRQMSRWTTSSTRWGCRSATPTAAVAGLGGQRRRFALARGLIVRPRILICDEVVSRSTCRCRARSSTAPEMCRGAQAGLAFVSTRFRPRRSSPTT